MPVVVMIRIRGEGARRHDLNRICFWISDSASATIAQHIHRGGGPMSSMAEDAPPGQPIRHAGLTRRQEEILRFIRGFGRYAPSMREIGEAVGLTSTSAVSYQLSSLQDKGYLRRVLGRPRTVKVVLPGQPAARLEAEDLADALDLSSQDATYVPVDVIGQIAAGSLHSAEQVNDDTLTLPKQLVGEGTLFMLKVT